MLIVLGKKHYAQHTGAKKEIQTFWGLTVAEENSTEKDEALF